jgi:hypothetical protein
VLEEICSLSEPPHIFDECERGACLTRIGGAI